ncbi:hypothetical protein [Paenibacillus sp. Aloe-11]|uniref:hypothetical protein n=1 Tax=Paenibacillus sp. Aloe-11 TaxID=1050222 RepID=UPI0002F54732|nr:hypothetical protein [Paenibacillus sp. Aloe-11]
MISRQKIMDWAHENGNEEVAHLEVVRFVKEMFIQIEFGAFDPDDEDYKEDNDYDNL